VLWRLGVQGLVDDVEISRSFEMYVVGGKLERRADGD